MKKILLSIRRWLVDLLNKRTLTNSGVAIFIERGAIPENIRQDLLRDKYEDTERNLLLKFLAPGMKVLEIGTGIGFISLLASKIVGDKNVFCYEANASLEEIIRRNYALNGLYPQLTMKAVTVDGQPVTFYKSQNIISSSIFDRARNDEKTSVESVEFQSVLNKVDPDVLIMDIEGAEIDLFKLPSLGKIRHIIVELHPHVVGEEKIDKLLKHMESIGYLVKERDRKTVYMSNQQIPHIL